MKNRTLAATLAITCILTACNFSKSVSKDLMTGLSTKGDGLSADDVYISNGNDRVTDNTFLYGETIFTNFVGVEGFVVEDGNIYPEMDVVVISKAGDTIFQNKNLLGGKPIASKAATVNGNVILATPIQSGTTYTVTYNITDTKGDGRFSSELELELEKDPMVKINTNGLSLKEAYIYNQDKRTIITNAEINFDTNTVLDLQGLRGYKLTNGKGNLGLSVKVTDADGKLFLDLPDLLKDRELAQKDIEQGLGATVKINKGTIANPATWTVRIWDKNSDADVIVNTRIKVL